MKFHWYANTETGPINAQNVCEGGPGVPIVRGSAAAGDGRVVSDTSGKTAPEVYRLEEQVGFVLRLAAQRHAAIFQAHSLMKLTPTQFSALIRIAEVGTCSQNHLGRLTAMDVATIKGVIDRLREKALVTLRRDPGDKRRTVIALTPMAEEMIGQLQDVGRTITEATLEPLTAQERVRLLRLLKKIA